MKRLNRVTSGVFVTALWGNEFTDVYLQLGLPSQLAPRNLAAFDYFGGQPNEYWILTTRESADKIRSSSLFNILSSIIEVRFIEVDELVRQFEAGITDSYSTMTSIHQEAMRQVVMKKAAFIWLNPDTIWSNGYFEAIARLMKQGKQVLIWGTRCNVEDCSEELRSDSFKGPHESIAISSRDLVKLSLRHIHEEFLEHFWTSSSFDNNWPSNLYWPVGDTGVLCFASHFQLFVTYPNEEIFSKIDWTTTLDANNYLELVAKNLGDIHIVKDSDEMYSIGLSKKSPQRLHHQIPSVFSAAKWVHKHATPLQRRIREIPVVYHSNGIDHELLDNTMREIQPLLDIIQNLVTFLDSLAHYFHQDIINGDQDSWRKDSAPTDPSKALIENILESFFARLQAGQSGTENLSYIAEKMAEFAQQRPMVDFQNASDPAPTQLRDVILWLTNLIHEVHPEGLDVVISKLLQHSRAFPFYMPTQYALVTLLSVCGDTERTIRACKSLLGFVNDEQTVYICAEALERVGLKQTGLTILQDFAHKNNASAKLYCKIKLLEIQG